MAWELMQSLQVNDEQAQVLLLVIVQCKSGKCPKKVTGACRFLEG